MRRQPDLIGLWAELLAALDQGEPAIAESAQEMALEVPTELVNSVNAALRSRGSRFQVHPTTRGMAAKRRSQSKPEGVPRPDGHVVSPAGTRLSDGGWSAVRDDRKGDPAPGDQNPGRDLNPAGLDAANVPA